MTATLRQAALASFLLAAPTAALEPPALVAIPAGDALIGAPADDPWGVPRERPARMVFIPGFRLGVTPVTFAQFDACAAAGACARPADRNWGRGDRPVIHVNAADTEAFIAWARARFGERYRLPTEAEWERAARAGTLTPFSWGAEIRPGLALCHQCGPSRYAHGTAPVAQFPPNAFGLRGMAGNVWEWTADCWTESHGADAAPDCARRPLKGGSWYFHWRNSRPAARTPARLAARHYDVGFRLAADAK